ncbi:MAG: hypothetical protein GY799_19965 [Desulfobulbaceae bacterium]|nr:hypothetical protein [Desulfobulbaceae bacterium]
MHKRNVLVFGPTTLRSTICYGMLRMAELRPGEIVCDPLCGGGSIPIEGALEWKDLLILSGDSHDKAIERTTQNIQALKEKTCKEFLVGFCVQQPAVRRIRWRIS